jgi:hypothetical protein
MWESSLEGLIVVSDAAKYEVYESVTTLRS